MPSSVPAVVAANNTLSITPPMTVTGAALPPLALNPPPPPAAFQIQPIAVAPKLDVAAPLFTPSPSLSVPAPLGVQGSHSPKMQMVNPLDIAAQIGVLQLQSQQSMAKLELYALQLNTLQIINQQSSSLESLSSYQSVYGQYQMELNHSLMLSQTIQSLQCVLQIAAAPQLAGSGGATTPSLSTEKEAAAGNDAATATAKKTVGGKLETIEEEGEEQEMEEALCADSVCSDVEEEVAQIAGLHTNYHSKNDPEGDDSDGVSISPRTPPTAPTVTGKNGEKLEVAAPSGAAAEFWKFREITSTTNLVGEGGPDGREHKEDDDGERIKKQMRLILNKITVDNFDKLSQDISGILQDAIRAVEGIEDAEERRAVRLAQFKAMIKVILRCILEKAIHEPPLFGTQYARLCYSLYLHSEHSRCAARQQKLFRMQLLSLCHAVFKRARSAALCDPAAATPFIGIISMIGELFAFGLVSWNVISSGILQEILPPQSAVDIEAVCTLLRVSGHNFDRVGHREDIDAVVGTLRSFAEPFGFRTQCLVEQIREMRSNDWAPKTQRESPLRVRHEMYSENGNLYDVGVRSQWKGSNGRGDAFGAQYPPRRGHGQYAFSGYAPYHGHSANAVRRGHRGPHGPRHGQKSGGGGAHRNGHHFQRRKPKMVRPSVEFVADVTLPDRSHYPSDVVLTKTWAMKNSGQMPWGDDVELVYFKGDAALCLGHRYPVASAVPGQVVEMSATVRTPSEPGRYCTYFRLQKNGKFFGPRVWVDIIVSSAASECGPTAEAKQNSLCPAESNGL